MTHNILKKSSCYLKRETESIFIADQNKDKLYQGEN